jgi:hypothetical protein
MKPQRFVAMVLCSLVLAVILPRVSWSEGFTKHPFPDDHFTICKYDGASFQCLEVRVLRDPILGEPWAYLSFTEYDENTNESRFLNCTIDPASVTLDNDARFLREASVNVTVWPQSPECSSGGSWPTDTVSIALAMRPTGQEQRWGDSHGTAEYMGNQFRYHEVYNYWATVATGTIFGISFDDEYGSVFSSRRLDLERVK